ncbi:GntR family transcriptional regulator [Bacillus sp. JJ1532]|uniref:GntR family transcriptional regulator n=1 Tax=Bacillus sp. JJ1532 TaxID=3122958 RepID=UPI003000C1BE
MSVYEEIKARIIKGVYKQGERLTEEFLASDLSISRTPIREAIKQLQLEGLITPLKRGMIVSEYSKEDVRKIYDLRILLEGHIAYNAAIYRTDDDIQQLQLANKKYSSLVEVFKQEEDIMEKIIDTNNLFHNALSKAANNEYTSLLLSKVIIEPLVYQSLYWYNKDRLKYSVNAHEAITNAIIERDANRAKAAMLEHMYQGRDTVLKLYTAKLESDQKIAKTDI